MWTNQRERCSLQALHLMSPGINNAILGCFGNYACVVNMMSIHTIYVLPQQQKTGAKSVLGDSKFAQIMNIQPTEEIAYHQVLIIISKKIIEDPKHQET